eukprot:GEMP01080861.1.p1 GENE.GEMP01080861.1~~GEMP01080861.1.p1  ORF type:complete len:109 (-),score=10.44 GEMP01080861.1:221-547(-)
MVVFISLSIANARIDGPSWSTAISKRERFVPPLPSLPLQVGSCSACKQMANPAIINSDPNSTGSMWAPRCIPNSNSSVRPVTKKTNVDTSASDKARIICVGFPTGVLV